MSGLTIFALAVGVSMDAFAVSVCKGLSVRKATVRQGIICGLYFGSFQALMPLIGYFLGSSFASAVSSVDHWIAFALLGLIGANMIREALKGEDEELNASFGLRTMVPLAVATSIDALAVGVTFVAVEVNVFFAVAVIGVTTFCFSAVGVKIGQVVGSRFKAGAEIFGGIILIILGIKILLEHFI